MDERQAGAKYVFRRGELSSLRVSPSALYAALQRLEQAGRVRKVGGRLGVWVIVPPEYREVGAPPAAWVLDDVMAALGVPYYVGLRTAAEWLGATHHAVQTLQVVVGRQLRPFAIGRERLRFFEKRTAASTPTMPVPGQANVTEREPVFDLVRIPYAPPVPGLAAPVSLLSYDLDEMLATKMRALLQREHGRDLFDLAHAWDHCARPADLGSGISAPRVAIAPHRAAFAFTEYMRREGTAVSFRSYADDLDRKLALARFRADVRDVLATDVAYDVHAAAATVRDVFLPHLPGGPMAAVARTARPAAVLAG